MKLKELRLKESKTQNQLAEELGITQFTYCNYETGKTKPNIDLLKNIADYYNVSLDYLCDRQFNSKIGYIPEDRVDLIKVIANLPDKDFAQIGLYVKGYVDGKISSNDLDFYTNDEKMEIKNYDRR